VGWEKVACWSTKAIISLKCIKIDEKLLWRACTNSPMLFRTVPSPTPYAPLPQDWGFATPTQNCNHYYLRNGLSYGLQIWPLHSQGQSKQKPMKNLGEMGVWAYPKTRQILSVLPIISGMGKATNFNFGRYIHRVHAKKSLLKIWEKRERGCIQRLPKFF